MPTAPRTLARAQILTLLKGDADLIAAVPAARIYRQATTNPTWPFIKLGPPTTLRLRSAQVDGGTVSIDVHAFARARESGGQVVEHAEDHADRIGTLIEAALSDRRVTLGTGEVLLIEMADNQLMQDREPEAFHWMAQFNVRVLAGS